MSSQQQEDVIQIKAVPASAEEKSWIEHYRTESQGAMKRLEETAKYISGLSSVSLTLMLGPNKEVFSTLHSPVLLKAGIVSWLLSILLTLAVVFPFRYRFVSNSYSSIKRTHSRIIRVKFIFLILGSLLFLAGLSLIAWIFLFSPLPVKQ
jgi:hypothetical protein